jgi:DNA-binding transcriptional ArsR family regulator
VTQAQGDGKGFLLRPQWATASKGCGGLTALQIATVGGDEAPLLIGLRDYPASKVYLLYHDASLTAASVLKEKLKGLMIEAVLTRVEGDRITGTLKAVGEILAQEGKRFDRVVANIAGGSAICGCSLLMAAFVHGLDAIHVVDGRTVKMPVLRFSYTEIVGDEKFRILDAMMAKGGVAPSLEYLAEKTGLNKAAVVRHLKSSRDPRGLEDLGLVTIERGDKGLQAIRITESGKLLMVGRHAGHGHE